MKLQALILSIFLSNFLHLTFCQEFNCKAFLRNDTLTIENEVIYQQFLWNNGNLIRLAMGEVQSRKSLISADVQPSFYPGSQAETQGKGILKVDRVEATAISYAHLKVEVQCSINNFELLRVFRLYPNCPAIACDLYVKGKMDANGIAVSNSADLKNIEDEAAKRQGESQVVITDKLRLPGNHWKARAVEFFDITDRNNTLVQTYDRLLYSQESRIRGNLLLLTEPLTGKQMFMLKEAPTSSVQLYYTGSDFILKRGEVKVTGLGVSAADVNDSTWTRAYGVVTGISFSSDEFGIFTSLRQYQHLVRKHLPGRDNMILMNTWGDRGQDTKVNEAFCLAELEAGAKLGITHFQLDDGWQTGRSSNSAYQGGSLENIWRNPDYWKPDNKKFPHGLDPIIKRGKELGIEICLWFNPSADNGNVNWEKDADVLISLNKEYGIRTFKLDGVKMPDKQSEVNFRKMLDKVVKETNGDAVFNLDVTAGRRGGYNFFNEYGNIFLENRYTDWQNYYPYWTLRNLWMLSRYIPAQNLQIEFLNIWRNQKNYSGDPFGPANYSFDYAFAITMMAQPLAWFEATGLPQEAFQSSTLIKTYRALQSDIHKGIILPIGEEPDGIKWTGFQSISDQKGYFLVFREASPNSKALVKTWLPAGTKVKCVPVSGSGKPFISKVDENGNLPFELNAKNSFALYKYIISK